MRTKTEGGNPFHPTGVLSSNLKNPAEKLLDMHAKTCMNDPPFLPPGPACVQVFGVDLLGASCMGGTTRFLCQVCMQVFSRMHAYSHACIPNPNRPPLAAENYSMPPPSLSRAKSNIFKKFFRIPFSWVCQD